MENKFDKRGSNSINEGSIVDAEGKPTKSRITWKDRWGNLSSKVKITVISVTTCVALLAAFLTNIEKIGNFFKAQAPPPSVPKIVVKLSNSSDESVIVSARGDFTLWLPGPEAYHTMGKYEFFTLDGESPTGAKLVIPPKDTVTVHAKIMNEKYYSAILSRSDCDLNLLVYRAGAGLTYTNQMPFTKEAIKKYYIEADVGK
jgi:hypothetical protein